MFCYPNKLHFIIYLIFIFIKKFNLLTLLYILKCIKISQCLNMCHFILIMSYELIDISLFKFKHAFRTHIKKLIS